MGKKTTNQFQMLAKLNRVAVVHDWMTGMRGGEVVLEAILELFPQAEIFTLLHNPGSMSQQIERRTIHTSFINRIPGKKKGYRRLLPLFPTAIEKFDFHGFDLVVSSSHCVASGVIVPPDVPHISFVHSPMRYVWDMYYDYFPDRGLINRFVVPLFANYLRMWDAASASRVDEYVSNSRFVAKRIQRFYGKQATVIHPPCVSNDVQVPSNNPREDFYLVAGALVPYKKVELAIQATGMIQRPLIIAGDGPEKEKLMKIAGPNVSFLGYVSDEKMEELFDRAKALLFPGLEDFGILPVEAQARGCPVIAYGRGGALETILPGKTGMFFEEQTPESLSRAILEAESRTFQKKDFQSHVKRFTHAQFLDQFGKKTEELLRRFSKM